MKRKTTTRRTFIKTAGASTAAILISGMPRGWAGGVYASDSPETANIRFGIIALTDCAPIVMAHELGYFKKFGINSTVAKEASWAVIRDKLTHRREPGDAHAARHAARLHHGSGRISGQADDCPVAPQSQRPGHHSQQQAQGGGGEDPGRDQAAGREGQGRRRSADLRDDVSTGNPRHVAQILAGVWRHQSGSRREPHHHPAAADGGEHEGRQDGRLLRRRAVEQPSHRRRHRVHRRHHAAAVERPSRKSVRVHRGVRARRTPGRYGPS